MNKLKRIKPRSPAAPHDTRAAGASRSDEEVRVVPVASLVANPRQAAMFEPATAEVLDALLAEVRRHGLRHPIEVVEVGKDLFQILDGHTRKLVCEMLGRPRSRC